MTQCFIRIWFGSSLFLRIAVSHASFKCYIWVQMLSARLISRFLNFQSDIDEDSSVKGKALEKRFLNLGTIFWR